MNSIRGASGFHTGGTMVELIPYYGYLEPTNFQTSAADIRRKWGFSFFWRFTLCDTGVSDDWQLF